MTQHSGSDRTPPWRRFAVVAAAPVGVALVFASAIIIGSSLGLGGTQGGVDSARDELSIALNSLPEPPSATATTDLLDPAAGCPTPAVTVEEAQDEVVSWLGFSGEIQTPFELLRAQYMSWDAYSWAFEMGQQYPEPGCAWVVEMQGTLLFNDFPPPVSKDASPQVAEMHYVRAQVDGQTGDVVSQSVQSRAPEATRPPPPSGWPTAEPLDMDSYQRPTHRVIMPTPPPPWFPGEAATPTP